MVIVDVNVYSFYSSQSRKALIRLVQEMLS